MRLVTDGHLGGYVEGGDPATEYPDLWRWLVEDEHGPQVRDVIDVGCGEGVTVDFFAGLGCNVLGIDGMPQDHPLIVQHDFTQGELRPRPHSADLVWSCEFVEHVEDAHALNYLDVFSVGRLVLMTHAVPGQPGWHHVNCREPAYWIALLASIGYTLDDDLTAETRQLAALNTHPANYYAATGLAFRQAG